MTKSDTFYLFIAVSITSWFYLKVFLMRSQTFNIKILVSIIPLLIFVLIAYMAGFGEVLYSL